MNLIVIDILVFNEINFFFIDFLNTLNISLLSNIKKKKKRISIRYFEKQFILSPFKFSSSFYFNGYNCDKIDNISKSYEGIIKCGLIYYFKMGWKENSWFKIFDKCLWFFMS